MALPAVYGCQSSYRLNSVPASASTNNTRHASDPDKVAAHQAGCFTVDNQTLKVVKVATPGE